MPVAMAAPAQATGSRSNQDPAGEALLIIAHGDRGGGQDNRLAAEVARRMRGSGRFSHVGVAFLSGDRGIGAVAHRLRGRTVRVCPLFMSDGHYVREAIPERLGPDSQGITGDHRYAVMRPAGLNPLVARIVADIAAGAAAAAGLAAACVRLLAVAHGSSKDPASRLAAEALAGRIAAMQRFAAVDTAFLEEPPLLDARLRALPGPLVVTGLFIGEGLHGAEDMAAAVAAAGRDDLYLASPLARSQALVATICADILATRGGPA